MNVKVLLLIANTTHPIPFHMRIVGCCNRCLLKYTLGFGQETTPANLPKPFFFPVVVV